MQAEVRMLSAGKTTGERKPCGRSDVGDTIEVTGDGGECKKNPGSRCRRVKKKLGMRSRRFWLKIEVVVWHETDGKDIHTY